MISGVQCQHVSMEAGKQRSRVRRASEVVRLPSNPSTRLVWHDKCNRGMALVVQSSIVAWKYDSMVARVLMTVE